MRLYPLLLGVIKGPGVPIPGYLIQTGDGTNVLIDTGSPLGAAGDQPIHIGPEHDLISLLGQVGVNPGDIEYVICSHLDPDHSGNHDLFPGAEFVIQRSHYELARSGQLPRLEVTRKQWDNPDLRYRTVDGDTELLPGIELIESGGHVPGHQSVLVRLPNTGAILLACDAIPTADTLDPDTRALHPFDMDEPAIRASTRKLVELADRENAFIIHGHDAEQWQALPICPKYYD